MRPLQAEIIKALGVKPTIDPEKEIRRSVDFLKAYLKKNTFLKTYFRWAGFDACRNVNRKGDAGDAGRNR